MGKIKKTISVDIYTVYQLLIGDCRYGYTRNNHLMPGCAYANVKEYLPKMYKVDKEYALHTAQQLCDECISLQLIDHFFDGLDDEFGNRKEAIDFVEYLLDFITEKGSGANFPYNYSEYREYLDREKKLKYRVFEREGFCQEACKTKEITKESLTKQEADHLLFYDILKSPTAEYYHLNIKSKEYPVRIIGEILKIIAPDEYKNKIYSIELVKEDKHA